MKQQIAKRRAILADLMAITLTFVATAVTAFAQPSDVSIALVKMENGMIRGTVENDVIAFRGIPFAEPPVGRLRWRPPQRVKAWDEIKEASKFRPDPVQPQVGGSLPVSLVSEAGTSEDCLYLNVWRPAKTDGRPLAVMVWIYGGGLTRGGASIYPGEYLAKQGIVVVTFNYRVGRLGFFSHPALAAETPDAPRGNYGYMDQIAALEWVQRNIATFGGDPQQVTLAGESAGGGSVLVMLTSPLARGLFQRAILQSPGIPTPRSRVAPMRTLAAAETIAIDYARSLGVSRDEAAQMVRLRTLPADVFIRSVEEYAQAIFGGPQIPGLSFSIIDGRLVVEPPEDAIRGGRWAKVPVLVGANDYDLAIGPARTKEELFALFGRLSPEARKLYDANGDASFRDVFQAMMCDQAMIEPSQHMAELVAAAGEPAYFYRFSYVAERQRGRVGGATHGVEIVYAFDAVAAVLNDAATQADLDMARTTSGYWVDFIKTGNPNGGGRVEWPRYDPATREVMNFMNAGVKAGPDPVRERLDLWREVWEQAGR